ncbi:DUF1707 domain-containing protein [Amycolatopsis sp.]|uniref:DUF1707 SHOCT-like domain-containing protein n=1 Tax=Amycolatopsis sp. TaxID=37632 RepID=UPI002E0BDA85|nr:DUF1707 domain-containing protein [Amycolatopsis sp.]
MSPASALRCSDEERERASAVVHRAAGEGRLSLEEVEERLAEIYTARFRHELDAIIADLPPLQESATGWRPVLTAARHQLAGDLSALTGRGQNVISPRRRLVLTLAMLGLLLLVVAMVVLALHGIVGGDEVEHHGVGRD